MNNNGRTPPSNDFHDVEDVDDSAGFDPKEYAVMLLLEQLESLEEEMDELGVKTLDDVRQRITELHRQLDKQV